MGRSLLIACVAVVLLALWMLSGQTGSKASVEDEASQTAASEPEETAAPKMKVQTRRAEAQTIDREIVVQGQLEPAKVMALRAETAGTVRELSLKKGQRISSGQTLVTLSEGDRVTALAAAKANLAQVNSEYQAARKLASQGLQSKLSLEASSALREASQAQVNSAQLELDNIKIDAPIDALVENIAVEEGDFIERGAQVATLVDNSSLLVTGHISQQHIEEIQNGQAAVANLVTGESLQGKVSYISSMADNTTRSFYVEVLIEQAPETVFTGISTEIVIPVETLRAHRVSPAVLALNDDGALGVKALGDGNKVVFHEVEVVKTENNGAWVTGLPEQVTLITLGQGFVNPGEVVEPVAVTGTTNTSSATSGSSEELENSDS